MTSTVDAGDAQLACTDVGSGSPVVWLHGSGPGATGMTNFGGNLAAFEDYRNIVVDLPGWGSSPRPATDEPLIFHAAERVCRAMTALGVERAHLVGNSYGGAVAMRMAMRCPERVDRLVLMAPAGSSPGMRHRGPSDLSACSLRVLPHCRHWVQYERAPEFNHIVREFLQGGATAVAEG